MGTIPPSSNLHRGLSFHLMQLCSGIAMTIAEESRSTFPLSIGTCPHYLVYDSENIIDGSTLLKCSPPIRGPENRDILFQKWKNAQIDSISSAHVAFDVGLKFIQSGNMTRALGGIGAISSSLPACFSMIRFDAAHTGASLEEQIDLLCNSLCRRPAEIIGLSRVKGSVRQGGDADFVLFDPEALRQLPSRKEMRYYALDPFIKNDAIAAVNDGTTFVQEMLEEKDAQRFSPHYRLRGLVKTTYLRGKKIFDKGEVIGNPHGQILRRSYSGAVVIDVLETKNLPYSTEGEIFV